MWLDPEQSGSPKGQPDDASSADLRASVSLHCSMVVRGIVYCLLTVKFMFNMRFVVRHYVQHPEAPYNSQR